MDVHRRSEGSIMATDEVVVEEGQHVCEKNKIVDNEKISVSDVIYSGPFFSNVSQLVDGDPWGPMNREYYVPTHKKCNETVGGNEAARMQRERSGSMWNVKHQTFVWPYDSLQGRTFKTGRA